MRRRKYIWGNKVLCFSARVGLSILPCSRLELPERAVLGAEIFYSARNILRMHWKTETSAQAPRTENKKHVHSTNPFENFRRFKSFIASAIRSFPCVALFVPFPSPQPPAPATPEVNAPVRLTQTTAQDSRQLTQCTPCCLLVCILPCYPLPYSWILNPTSAYR